MGQDVATRGLQAMPAFRQLPHNLDAEKAVLGAIFANNKAYDAVAETLKPDHFALAQHARIYEACGQAIARGGVADPVTLKNLPDLADVGGAEYLTGLASLAVGIINATEYARLVVDMARRRHLIDVGETLVDEAYDGEDDASRIQERAEARLFDLAERGERVGVQPLSVYVREALQTAEAAFKRKGSGGLPTGLTDLDNLLGGLYPGDLIILAGRPSMGKAQPLTAKVLMRDGSWKPMGDLRLGDELASVDGSPSRVVGVFPRGVRPVYRVTMSDGRSTRACGEHLWAVEGCRLGGRRVLSTDDIRAKLELERYQRRLSLPLASGHFGRDDGLLMDPWLLGALIGNGCMTESHLSISTADAATLYRVQTVVGHDRLRCAGNNYDYRISRAPGVGVLEALQAYGLHGKPSFDKFIPEPYLRANRETRMEVLRGLLDTDGWVETFGAVRYATSSARLASDLQSLVRSVGGVCRISKKRPTFTSHGKKKDGLLSYVCNISHPDRASLMSLKRKQRRCEKPARFRRPTIISVEADGEEETRCIMVTHPENLYVTDDYIVTHNTALATNIAFNVADLAMSLRQTPAVAQISPVQIQSLEMSGAQLVLREMSARAGFSSHLVRTGRVSQDQFQRLQASGSAMEALPVYIDQRPALAIQTIRGAARRFKRQHGLSLLVVDYLQLAAADTRNKNYGRVQEVSEITAGLKAVAKDLDVPVLALSQLSRAVEARDNKRPQLSDLRESGSIEQDADVVMFIYREEYYLDRDKPEQRMDESDDKFFGRLAKWEAKIREVRNVAEVIVAKQRHGPIGTASLRFDHDTLRFANLGTM